jgi:hypothetical protein
MLRGTSNCSTMSRPIAGRRPKKKTSPTRSNANGEICSWSCESPDGLYLKTLVERGMIDGLTPSQLKLQFVVFEKNTTMLHWLLRCCCTESCKESFMTP